MQSKAFSLSHGKRRKRTASNHVYHEYECPRKYCEHGDLQTFCSPSQICPNTPNLPNCWFSKGVTSVDFQQYIHYLNIHISCMPVCLFASKDSRMPAISNVSSVGQMCQWYNTHGRCPDFQPPPQQ